MEGAVTPVAVMTDDGGCGGGWNQECGGEIAVAALQGQKKRFSGREGREERERQGKRKKGVELPNYPF